MSDTPRQHDPVNQAIRRRLRRLASAPVEVAGLKRRLEHLLACARRDTNQARPPNDRKRSEDRVEPW